jgi:hypothetical protein
VSLEYVIHYFLAVAKIRELESSESFSEVDEPVARGETEDAKRPSNAEPLPSATGVPFRSSIRTRSACNDSASVMAARSPALPIRA